jgi:hypothetical protein
MVSLVELASSLGMDKNNEQHYSLYLFFFFLFVERRWPPLNYETSDEEELSAIFDSLGEDELDVHQFEAMAPAIATEERRRYSSQSFEDYSFRAAVVPPLCSQQRPTIVRSNTPPPLGKTITTLRYYTYYHRICSRIARVIALLCKDIQITLFIF